MCRTSPRQGGSATLTVGAVHPKHAVRLSADAVEVVEHDFGQVARELRAAAARCWVIARCLGTSSGVRALIAHELIAMAESVQAARPGAVVVIGVGSSSSAMHRMVGSVAVNLAHHSPVPVPIVP